MVPLMPMSPSSLALYKQCPRKYQARYITKEFKSEFGGPAVMRALDIHALLEYTLKHGRPEGDIRYEISRRNSRTTSWAMYPQEWLVCQPFVAKLQAMVKIGWAMYVEMEAATDGAGNVCGWWDKECYMRAKLDVFMVSPNKKSAIIIDWKTGKPENINPWQMDFIGVTLVPEFGCRKFGGVHFMVDAGGPKSVEIVIDRALPKYLSEEQANGSRVAPIFKAIKELQLAHMDDVWPATPNRLCRFCEVPICQFK